LTAATTSDGVSKDASRSTIKAFAICAILATSAYPQRKNVLVSPGTRRHLGPRHRRGRSPASRLGVRAGARRVLPPHVQVELDQMARQSAVAERRRTSRK
jgi:hypothetical protein